MVSNTDPGRHLHVNAEATLHVSWRNHMTNQELYGSVSLKGLHHRETTLSSSVRSCGAP